MKKERLRLVYSKPVFAVIAALYRVNTIEQLIVEVHTVQPHIFRQLQALERAGIVSSETIKSDSVGRPLKKYLINNSALLKLLGDCLVEYNNMKPPPKDKLIFRSLWTGKKAELNKILRKFEKVDVSFLEKKVGLFFKNEKVQELIKRAFQLPSPDIMFSETIYDFAIDFFQTLSNPEYLCGKWNALPKEVVILIQEIELYSILHK